MRTAAPGCPAAHVYRAAAVSAVDVHAVEENSIRTFNLCFLGFGNVNRTLIRLLEDRARELREGYGISFYITGVASRRLGWIADANGLDAASLLAPNFDSTSRQLADKSVRPTPQQRSRMAGRRPR